MNTIRVYGPLAEFLGRRVFEAVVDTAIEALRFLNANFPGLRQHLANQRYCIAVGDHLLTADELSHPIGRQELRIIPAFSGEIFDFIGDVISAGVSAVTAAAPSLLAIGVSVGLQYLSSQLQSKTPQVGVSASSSTQNDPRSNFSFSGVQNTARAGVPVPIVYGEVIVGSVVVSAGVDTVQVKA